MTDEMTWEAPPERVTYDWPEIAKQLKRRKGKWLKVFDQDRNTLATAINAGSIAALRPDDGFEVKTRNNVREPGKPRLCTMYVRYNPQTKGK